MNSLTIKSPKELKIMEEGGKILSLTKHAVVDMIDIGVSAFELEKKAVELIEKHGAEPAFKKVPGYSWATCVNVNAGLVHGIPHESIIFKDGDVVSIDLGVFYKGFYTDTSFTKAINPDMDTEKFLEAGMFALKSAIDVVKPGNKVSDISEKIEDTITLFGYTPIEDLVGHGIGKNLHEVPEIPCFLNQNRERSLTIASGMAFAIEVMYTQGKPDIVTQKDGWTISTRDGKISALFEDTVIVTQKGHKIVTG